MADILRSYLLLFRQCLSGYIICFSFLVPSCFIKPENLFRILLQDFNPLKIMNILQRDISLISKNPAMFQIDKAIAFYVITVTFLPSHPVFKIS